MRISLIIFACMMKKELFNVPNAVRHYQQLGDVILLESQKQDHPSSTKNLLAAQPKAWIKSFGSEIRTSANGEVKSYTGNPWEALKEFQLQYSDWLVGYLGYDLKNFIEELVSENEALYRAPDMYFMVPEVLIEIQHNNKVTFLKGEETAYEDAPVQEFSVSRQEHIPKKEYIRKIEKAQFDISEGNYYEVNLSHPLRFLFDGDAFSLYQKMKERGPVPFASYMDLEEIKVCCSSPERFLAKRGNRVWSQPIKGTSSRGGSEDDADSKTALHLSEKNRAENLMIVDLVRNDLNRVAIKGSVRVKDLFEIQSFETVHQMVSTVECEVSPETNSIEIIKACFPMGSMTGAPKISAMKAIETIEDYKRGIYSGAIGYIQPDGDFDFNVVIRTAVIRDNKLTYPVGGAITSDSVPEEEWEETLIKARALVASLD